MWLDNTVSPATGMYSSAPTFNFNGSITTVQVAGNTALHAGNYNSYALPLSGGTITGSVYMNSWFYFNQGTGLYSDTNSANFYPNNGSYGAWRIAGSRNGWGGIEFDRTHQVCLLVNHDSAGLHNNSYGWMLRFASGEAKVGKGAYGGSEATLLDSSNYSSYALPLSGGTVTGATYFRVNGLGSSVYLGSITNASLQAYTSDSGPAYMSFHRASAYVVGFGLDPDNVLCIGGWSALSNRLQLDMSGNLTVAGSVTGYSDERLKTDWLGLPAYFVVQLAGVKSGTYTRTDTGERQMGVSAQDFQKFGPEAVSEDNLGMLSLAYGNAALASAVELAKEIVKLRAEIEAIKAQLH